MNDSELFEEYGRIEFQLNQLSIQMEILQQEKINIYNKLINVSNNQNLDSSDGTETRDGRDETFIL